MKTSTLETLIWVLIYGGLIGVGLGLSVQRTDAALGVGVIVVCGLAAAAGFVLIYVRSRMKATSQPSDQKSP